ncbi:MAG: type I methionyl aminopeptidase [Chitinivibrionales bacterium]|nr:type I methionyl aminopeptidase [Chitinivibrionales bacterium]
MIKRNDPCWCGSRKKYKKCHMQADQEAHHAQSRRPGTKFTKAPDEIAGMRKAGEFNGILMDYIRPFIKDGISTEELDRLVHDYTLKHGHRPATLNYHGYPKSICTSINNVVCHGIPSENEILKNGDIVNLDLTTIVDGFYGDSSETFIIGAVSSQARRLVEVTVEALSRGIDAARAGNHLKEIANAIEPWVISQGCSVVQQYTGHGIGKKFHENFSVYHHRARDCDDVVLAPGMTLTIEPMINLGGYEVITDQVDKWTVRTKDNSLSAQFEHTILVTEKDPEILTLTPSQKRAGQIVIL